MPQLGETVTEGTVVRWLKREGEDISADEALFDVSTDKVDAEVPSAFAGVVAALLVAEGDTVPIGTPVALIGSAAEAVEPAARPQRPDQPATDVIPPIRSSSAPRPASPDPATSVTAPPTAGVESVTGSGGVRPSRSSDGGVLTPVVRRLIDEHGLDPSAIVGSGRDGRITRADVLAAAATGSASSSPSSAAPAVSVPHAGPDDDVVAFSGARRTTAAAMKSSRATAAHAVVTTEIDYANVDPVRREAGLTYLPFVARATIDALASFPHLNASVGDDCLIVHRKVNLGIAVDLDYEALVVPVVGDAGGLRLAALAAKIVDLAGRARTRGLSIAELEGATFTITNVGAYGTVASAPIVMQPQLAVLSTDGVRMRPVARPGPSGEWAVAIHPVGNLSLSFDHRGVDGAYVAAFLARVRELLETRRWREELGP